MSGLILSLASVLVPPAYRGEWLAEWCGELWHIERAGGDGMAFCLGAFRDAFWLRRNARLPRAYGSLLIEYQRAPGRVPAAKSRLLDSPIRCIAFLGFLAVMSLAVYMLFAVHRVDHRLLGGLLSVAIGACLVVPSATSLSLGDYPGERHRFRRWLFLATKMALLFPTVICGALDITGALKHIAPLAIQFTFLGIFLGVRWALLDQRRRCPVCLRLLAKPVRIGESSHTFLEWNGIEIACLGGHGVLHVPERPSIWSSRQRWLHFDASWKILFYGIW
ncbi:MAG: hypothetical protein ACRD3F_17070 [Acidobacteriaceae bacterium]